MKHFLALFLSLLLIAAHLTSCAPSNHKGNTPAVGDGFPYTFTDSTGEKITVRSIERVAVLYGSFADAWIAGGGTLIATTSDAVNERNLSLGDNVRIVGSVKHPNLEEIVALSPTLVILSADIASHGDLRDALRNMGIPAAMMRIDYFDDYLSFLKITTDMTGRGDLFYENGETVRGEIEEIIRSAQPDISPRVLLLRAYSNGVKAKTEDNFTGVMLEELGCTNIANLHPSLLEEISIELIIREDPEYIFISTMGDEDKAIQSFNQGIASNPAWSELSAVKNGRVVFLPKNLFHYKPNKDWLHSYRYLKDILYPEH